ncbi:MAG: FAD-binding protein [Proteobacteria bacterium]|nr:FAD-binding protein [Pseudomonadota bacterium]MBU1585355.1 FAD-binding protein [Pseudomonadota bacterium]MBU2455315.1 FAD-binding protein [Pseudomonadota bacterium]MBU2629769.1 FAD-binding protein [Pseudomonadota bacterium]
MIKKISLRILPEKINELSFIQQSAADALTIQVEDIDAVQITRRSMDARSRTPVYQIQVSVYIGEPVQDLYQPVHYGPTGQKKQVIIVGSGPAGLFAALRLIELGIRPIVLDRGKNVRDRRFDLKTLQTDGLINPDSNYCFGEGGAGTYSDGKLYTRSTKRGDVKKILSILVQHGAVHDILVNAHPHIGSNRLPGIIKNIRDTILAANGQIHFNSRVVDLVLKDQKIQGVRTQQKEFIADAVILATGHSARDVYQLLDRYGILMEAKPFAMGVRVEHPQELINTIQYGRSEKSACLPPAEYSLACQVDGAGVYSFCMCPGGMLVPASTAPGELVLNGMSTSLRNLPYANAGVVVSIDSKVYGPYEKFRHFAGLEFQQQIEKKAFHSGQKTLAAPAQRLTDFLENKISSSLPATSYVPGIISFDLNEVLGPFISERLKAGLKVFARKMKGYVTNEATLLAVESRTSSPVRIPRNPKTWMHPQVKGLFPAGEGAGYAGGIVSSAIDGDTCADAVSGYLSCRGLP